MKHAVALLLMVLTSVLLNGETMNATQSGAMPRFTILAFGRDQVEITAQGVMSEARFRELFVDRYEFGGERYHPGKGASVRGVLLALASDRESVVTVPIWSWQAEDGTAMHLCQATDDGSAPALSVLSRSEGDLLSSLVEELASR